MNGDLQTHERKLAADLTDRVLQRLGFAQRPEATLAGLKELYAAWCQRVPFDNVRKLIHLRAGNPGPLPGSTPHDLFEAWLRHGTGGTCWSGADALHALLTALGFQVERGIATMLAAPHLPPNHGTVSVRCGESRFLVDSSMLHGEPLPLVTGAASQVNHGAWGVTCSPLDGRWLIRWRPLHRAEGFDCRVERSGASATEFAGHHDQTRGWSGFNFELTARVNRGERVIGVSFGHAVTLYGDGSVSRTPVDRAARVRWLIEELGLSEEIVRQLPDDIPTPPPPDSRTAQARHTAG